MKIKSFLFAIIVGYFLTISGALAEEKLERSGFWGGIDIGAGFVQRSFEGNDEDETNFFLGFKGGYTLTPNFLLGLELSGWLIDEGNINSENPDASEGISQVFVITRYYPSSSLDFFVKIGGGLVIYYIDRPGEPTREEGWGLTLGGGYDFLLNKNFAVTPFISYSFGEADNQEHNAITIGIGLTIQ